jgi:hypothetical protein
MVHFHHSMLLILLRLMLPVLLSVSLLSPLSLSKLLQRHRLGYSLGKQPTCNRIPAPGFQAQPG